MVSGDTEEHALQMRRRGGVKETPAAGRAENSQPGTLMRAPRLGEILYSHRGQPRAESLNPTAFETMPVPFLISRSTFP